MSIRVLLVDDHRMLREGLRALVSSSPDMEVVGEASDGRMAVEMAHTLAPDVIVMDIGMPELNGVDATRRVKAENKNVKIIALSTHTDRNYVHHMLEAGANGYVLKISAPDELVRAIRAVSLGQTYLCSELPPLAIKRPGRAQNGGPASVYATLGSREREVLQLVAEGKTSAETAKQMSISTKTVETHRRNIVQKLGLRGTAELTKYAVREGLTSLES